MDEIGWRFQVQATLCTKWLTLPLLALIDSGAQANFLDHEVAVQSGIILEPLQTPCTAGMIRPFPFDQFCFWNSPGSQNWICKMLTIWSRLRQEMSGRLPLIPHLATSSRLLSDAIRVDQRSGTFPGTGERCVKGLPLSFCLLSRRHPCLLSEHVSAHLPHVRHLKSRCRKKQKSVNSTLSGVQLWEHKREDRPRESQSCVRMAATHH